MSKVTDKKSADVPPVHWESGLEVQPIYTHEDLEGAERDPTPAGPKP